jgi:hypothetical protein
LVLDGQNHFFVASTGNSTNWVGEYDATTGATINAHFISHVPILADWLGLALDRNNNHLFIGDRGSQTVREYDAITGTEINPNFVSFGANSSRFGLVVDNSNHLFVTAHDSTATGGTVAEYDATTGATVNANFVTGLAGPRGLAFDTLNHLLVANVENNTVGEYDATTGTATNPAFINGQSLNGPWGFALDGNNHLLVSNVLGTIGEYDATTGATINAAFIGDTASYLALVTPVPEPSSLLLVAAAAGIGLTMRRQGWLGRWSGTRADPNSTG